MSPKGAVDSSILNRASRILAEELHIVLISDPKAAAEAAYLRGGPSVAELEVRIRARQREAQSNRLGLAA